ncbi:unnamed protein product [Heterobilharzia americana]|nr:unnamed protein product [Heterobilharzia americana]
MNFCEIRKVLPFFLGITTGIIIVTLKSKYNNDKIVLCSNDKHHNIHDKLKGRGEKIAKNQNSLYENVKQTYLIDIEKARNLHSSVRVLCYINTVPKTHRKKAVHVKNSWAKRCTKYLFMSSTNDSELLTVTDDDTFVVMENLRSVLSRHNPSDPFMMGYHFPYITKNGYFSGGAGYVLSREALKRIVEQAIDKHPDCPTYDEDKEDVKMSMCGQPVGVKLYHIVDLNGTFPFTWRREQRNHYLFQWRNLESEFLSLVQAEKHSTDPKRPMPLPRNFDHLHDPGDLLSDHLISLHYVQPFYMYLLEFIVYHLRPIQVMDYLN